ncbi:hypothetical protein LCGC14_2639780, partial [marine sediment metagenome]
MAFDIPSTSRFTQTPVIIKDNKETFGRWVRPNFLKEELLDENEIITLSIDSDLAGRPDVIADRQYGSPFLDWVVVMFNKPVNTVGFPKIGSVIKLPIPTLVALN